MMMKGARRLSYAKNKEGNTVYIDKLSDENKKGEFFCPHCNEAVYPKMGESKIWHFAHKGEPCAPLRGHKTIEELQKENKSVNSFMAKTKDKIEIGECPTYQCPLCRQTGKKKFAVKYRPGVFICKNCFSKTSSDELNRL